jgi:hypothetical protein
MIDDAAIKDAMMKAGIDPTAEDAASKLSQLLLERPDLLNAVAFNYLLGLAASRNAVNKTKQ